MNHFNRLFLILIGLSLASCAPFADTGQHEFQAKDTVADTLDQVEEDTADLDTTGEDLSEVSPDGDMGGDTGGLDGDPHIGFVYVGPVGDHGWTKTHDDARLYLEEVFDSIETRFEPSVAPPDALDVMDSMIEAGANIVIGTSFDFLSQVQQAAGNNPDVNFLITSGFVSSPNLGSYFGRMYQVLWLAGRLAGQVTETNRIGVIGAVVIPETVRHLNAFALGAQSVNPDVVIEIIWVQAWFDPEKEIEYTSTLITNGADIIYSGTDTPIATTEADGKTTNVDGTDYPVYTIGHDNEDTCSFAPETCLTSCYFNWGPGLEKIIQSMIDGTWDPHTLIWEGIQGNRATSMVYLSDINKDVVSPAVILDVEGFIPELANGDMNPFPGPLVDNTGTERLSGADATDDDLLRMCWYVDGIVQRNEAGEDEPAEMPAGCPGDY